MRSYYGNDLFAKLAATYDILRKITRLRVVQVGHEEQRRHDELTAPLDRLCRLTDLLLEAALSGKGVNPLDRGAQGAETMHARLPTTPPG